MKNNTELENILICRLGLMCLAGPGANVIWFMAHSFFCLGSVSQLSSTSSPQQKQAAVFFSQKSDKPISHYVPGTRQQQDKVRVGGELSGAFSSQRAGSISQKTKTTTKKRD